MVWGFGLSYIFFKILDAVIGLRVSEEEEIMGLDI
jgi:Amt family ammonium transporter